MMLKLVVFLLAVSQILAGVLYSDRNNERLKHANPKIVGGSNAEEGSFPYAAALTFPDMDYYQYCDAIIISERHLLTTAGCLLGLNANQIAVYVGSVYLSKGGSYYELSSYLIHPDYNPNYFGNDIAIITLESSLELGENVQLLSLPPKDLVVEIGENATLAGWGYIVQDPIEKPDQLQYLTQQVVSSAACGRIHGVAISDDEICLGGPKGQGACFGDAGSPLVYDKDNVTQLIGIQSWGSPCALGVPDVYVFVPFFVDWILANLN